MLRNPSDLRTLDIIGNRSVKRHGNWVVLRIHDIDRLRFEVDQDTKATNHIVAQTGKILKTDNWFHVAVVREGTTLRIYVDGVLMAKNSLPSSRIPPRNPFQRPGVANIKNNVALRLGHYVEGTARAFYEDLRIYHTALNQVQIQNLIPPLNRLLYPGQIELVATHGAAVVLTEDEANLFRFTPQFKRLRLGPNTGATLYKDSNFAGTFQKLYADVPNISLTKVKESPRSVHIWSTVDDPFTGDWIIKAPNGQNLSRNKHSLTTSRKHTSTEQFIFHYDPNGDRLLLIPAPNQDISQLRVGDEATVLVVDDSEQHKDAFSIRFPERDEWLVLNADGTFAWTDQQETRAVFHRAIKIVDNEGQAGELKVGEIALYQHRAYFGKTWIFSDSEQNRFGNFTSLRSFANLDNQISSIRLGPDTGVTLFANKNQVVNEAKRETEIEDFVDNVPRMVDTQIGNDNLSSFKIFRTVAQDAIFTSVTSKLSQDYRMANDELEEFSSYRSILRMAPNITEVEISATDLTTIEVEGDLFEIDEVRSVKLRPNQLQQIMITSEADGLSTPGLKFRTADMLDNQFVVIFPSQDANQKISELEDGALWNAKDAKGKLIVDQSKHTRAEIASVQNTIKRTMAAVITIKDDTDPNANVKAVAESGAIVSTKQVLSTDAIDNPWTLHFEPSSTDTARTVSDGSAGLVQDKPKIWEEPLEQNTFEQLVGQVSINTQQSAISSIDNFQPEFAALRLFGGVIDKVGDFLDDVGDAIKEGIDITIGVIDDAINVIIEVGGQVVRFVADTAKKVADFVKNVVELVVESIQQFIEFLRFLFDWDDILDTQRFLVSTINGALDSASEIVATAKEPVSNFISDAQEALDDGIDSLISTLGVDPDEIKEDSGFEFPEAAEWFLNKVLGGSKSSDSNTNPDTSQINTGDAFQQALQSLLAALVDVVEIGGTIFDGVFDTVETLIANPKRPELALAEILDTFRDVGIKILDFGENIIHAFLDLVVTAIKLFQDLLNLEIRIPLISNLFELLGAGKLTILNVVTVLAAIPVTVLSKLFFGKAPFQDATPEFPKQGVVASQQNLVVAQSQAQDESGIDIDRTRSKIEDFGLLALSVDVINTFINTGLDFVPEESDDDGESTRFLERMSLLLSGLSWLASFPASPVEPGGYPYNLLLDKNRVSKSQNEQEYWERVMWGWRTGMLGLDIAYAIAGEFDLVKPKQRLKRGDTATATLTTLLSLVDVGLTGRFLATIPQEEGRGREVANEILSRLPYVFCLLRNDPNTTTTLPFSVAALFGLNVIAGVSTTTFGILFLRNDLAALDEL